MTLSAEPALSAPTPALNTPSNAPIAIAVRGVSKAYRIYDRPEDRLKQMLWRGHRQYGREFWALRETSFEVRRGETLGIIGRNGSGKSTLLQIVAGTLAPSKGEVEVHGRVAALLELGSGFNPEFSGRENVLLNGAILGISRAEIESRFDEIAAFADIGEFIDQPVKTYSSGMLVRVAFSVAACIDVDVLIVDEALSVGDIFFQQKCFDRIRQLQRSGVTILYVSHDLVSVQTICDRVLLLKDGEKVFDGNPNEAVNRYYSVLGEQIGARVRQHIERPRPVAQEINLNNELIMAHSILDGSHPRHGIGGLEIAAVRVCDDEGEDTLASEMMHALRFQVLIQAHQPVTEPNLGFHLYDRFGNLVFATGTTQLGSMLPALEAGELIAASLRLELRVQPGEYTFNLVVGEPSAGDDPNVGVTHDSHELLGPLTIYPPRGSLLPFYGIAQLPITAAHSTPARL